ncbi:MAG: hypothetical protein ACFFBS_07100, partial [Promethearchaeota archaeon]
RLTPQKQFGIRVSKIEGVWDTAAPSTHEKKNIFPELHTHEIINRSTKPRKTGKNYIIFVFS